MTLLIGNILLFIGASFLFLGALGLVRMPDVYNRIQAGTKATTFGVMAMLAGIAVHHPDWSAKLFIIIIFVILTSPIASSTLARSAYLSGIKPFIKITKRISHDNKG
jgi:multicomponent Na+:H+ antiporter subunit G